MSKKFLGLATAAGLAVAVSLGGAAQDADAGLFGFFGHHGGHCGSCGVGYAECGFAGCGVAACGHGGEFEFDDDDAGGWAACGHGGSCGWAGCGGDFEYDDDDAGGWVGCGHAGSCGGFSGCGPVYGGYPTYGPAVGNPIGHSVGYGHVGGVWGY